MINSARCLYNKSLEDFIIEDSNVIFGILCDNYHGEALTTTRDAWKSEVSIMKDILSNYKESFTIFLKFRKFIAEFFIVFCYCKSNTYWFGIFS